MESDDQKLARLCAWCVDGNLAGAELELHEWCRQGAPPSARVLLGSLLARRGEGEHALAVLHRPDRSRAEVDLAQAQLLASVLIDAGLTGTARRVVTQMVHAASHDPTAGEWVHAMDVPGAAELPAAADGVAEQLVLELSSLPDLIPSLVAAQKLHRDRQAVALLRSAVGRIAREAADSGQQLSICQAMADLSLLADDPDEARRWAHRGLKLNPYSAGLALVLSLVSDDVAAGPPAVDVLAQAAEAHPQYADLQAALIRRQNADGLREAARLSLKEWLNRQPDHPLARQVQEELAA